MQHDNAGTCDRIQIRVQRDIQASIYASCVLAQQQLHCCARQISKIKSVSARMVSLTFVSSCVKSRSMLAPVQAADA